MRERCIMAMNSANGLIVSTGLGQKTTYEKFFDFHQGGNLRNLRF
jgi:hypothetical protein